MRGPLVSIGNEGRDNAPKQAVDQTMFAGSSNCALLNRCGFEANGARG
jgi:hypothetical protein